jgi:hypothetical protein
MDSHNILPQHSLRIMLPIMLPKLQVGDMSSLWMLLQDFDGFG